MKMKLLLMAILSAYSAMPQDRPIVIQGDRVENNGPVTNVSGNATVITGTHEVRANSVAVNSETGWVEANGAASVRSFGTKLSATDRELLAQQEKALAALKIRYASKHPDVRRAEVELSRLEARLKVSAWSLAADSIKLRLESPTQ